MVEHAGFAWADGAWRGTYLPGAVLYEMHVGTFTDQGTFTAVIDKLPHLVDLGVDAIELLPVCSFPGRRGWGYDGVSLFAPHAAYGGPDGLERLVQAAHAAGIGVVLDVVYNHLGPSGNHLGEFAPYFSDRHQTNWGDGINLDGPGSDEVRRFLIDNALMWFADYHIDGLRLDAVHALSDTSAVHFLEQLSAEVAEQAARLRRPLFLIGESDLNDPRFIRSRPAHGYGLDAAWADEWHHAVHAALTGQRDGYYSDFGSWQHLAKALRQAWVYDGVWSEYRGRSFGAPPVGLDAHQFVVFTQNHDQIGNRAAGERTSALMSVARLKAAAALLLLLPFTPMIFMGEEWAASTPWLYFTDFEEPDLAGAVREGRRREFSRFGWDPEQVPDPQDPATFAASRLDWRQPLEGHHAEMLGWYRDLVRLRRQLAPLTAGPVGGTGVELDADSGGLAVAVGSHSAVLANLGRGDWFHPCRPGGQLVLASDPSLARVEGGVSLPPETVAVVTWPG